MDECRELEPAVDYPAAPPEICWSAIIELIRRQADQTEGDEARRLHQWADLLTLAVPAEMREKRR